MNSTETSRNGLPVDRIWIDEARNGLLFYQGETYPLSEWLPIAAYAKKYDLPLTTVINRVERGNIPPADVVKIEEWGFTLLRDVAHPAPKPGRRFKENP